MEDRKLPITVGQGAGARVVTLDLPAVHADRRHHAHRPAHDAAARPLRRDRTASSSTSRPTSRRIVAPLGGHPRACEIDDGGAEAIAARSRGTPRVANRLLKRVRDFAEVRGAGHIDDARGERRARPARGRRRRARPPRPRDPRAPSARSSAAGRWASSTLAVAVGEESDTIEDVYEPYLLQQGFLMRTPRGRVATDAAFAHLGLEPPRGRLAAPLLNLPL